MDFTQRANKTLLTSLIALFTVAPAWANVVSSNDPDCAGGMTGRVFTVSADSVVKCVLKGAGNINGNGDAVNALGYITLDKTDGGGDLLDGALTGTPLGLTTGLSGTFNIAASVYDAYYDIVIGFKSGNGQYDPDWAAFLLADNTLTGSWTISGRQELSHAQIYGKKRPPSEVPEPMTLALFGLGLLGLGVARRFRSR